MPIKLNVPFARKDDVKNAGAIWIPDIKTWAVPDSIEDLNPFRPWLPENEGFIVKYPHVVAKSSRYCWKCNKETPLIALGAKNFFLLEYETNDTGIWTRYEHPVLFSDITLIEADFLAELQRRFSFFQFTYSKTQEQKVWANICIHCKSLQGDYFNFMEVDAPFAPNSPAEARQIQVERIPLRFDYYLNAGYIQSEQHEWLRF